MAQPDRDTAGDGGTAVNRRAAARAAARTMARCGDALAAGVMLASWLFFAAIPKREAWQNNTARKSPSVAKLWSSLLVPGRTTHVVLSDPGIVMLAVATGRRVRFSELGDRLFLTGWIPCRDRSTSRPSCEV